jgi:hypothetical protein
MKKKVAIIPIFLFVLTILVLDRFLFLPGRMEGTWDYEYGTYIGDSISFTQNIDIVNNFEVKIQDNKKLDSFYLIGCYFGNLYLLNKETLEYTKYVEYERNDSWF